MIPVETPNYLSKIVQSVANSNGIIDYETGPAETNEKGMGFQSEIFMLTISDKSSERKLNILIKSAFKDETIRTSTYSALLFENEIYFYSVVYPALEEFRESVGCPKQYELIAKCYETSMEHQNEFLALDNLKHQGFTTLDKQLDFTSDNVELLFKNYGYFHALSLAFKDKNLEKFTKVAEGMKPVLNSMFEANYYKEFVEYLAEEMFDVLEPGKDDILIEEFIEHVNYPLETLKRIVNGSEKYSVILHGDSWSNNLLFKNDDLGNNVDLRLIDFQLIRIGSPICDLAFAVYSDGSKSVLDRLDDYLKMYYDTLSSTLRSCNCDPDQLFPLSELKNHWKKYAVYGLILGGMIVRIKCTFAEDLKNLIDLDHDSDSNLQIYKSEKYDVQRFNKKIYDSITHIFNFGAP